MVSLRRDAHRVAEAEGAQITCHIAETICLDKDVITGNDVGNKFTAEDAMDGVSLDGSDSAQNITYLTRADFAGTFPKENVDSRAMKENVAALNLYTEEMADAWIDEDNEDITTRAKNGLMLTEEGALTELGYRLGSDADDEQWEDLLDQMSVAEMEDLVFHGYIHTAEVKSIGKPSTTDQDGPSQIGGFFGNQSSTGFPSSSTMACSWVKHFICNDGESYIYRDGVYTWMTEQALRRASLNILYMYTNAKVTNINYADEIGDDSLVAEIVSASSFVNKILVALDILAAVFLALGIWGIVKDQKRKKEMQGQMQPADNGPRSYP